MKRIFCLFMALTLAFVLAVPCFAVDDGSSLIVNGVSYPVITSNHGNIVDWVNEDSNRQVLIYNYGASVRMVLSETKIGPLGASIACISSTFVEGSKLYRYTLVDGAWVFNKSESAIKGGSIGSVDSVIASSRAYSSNTWFSAMEQHSRFRGALPVTILEVTEEQMVKTLPEMVGTMKTLALCGVGCLALLVVLSLFGKRSLLFLRR